MSKFENFVHVIASHVTADNVHHFASLVENLVKLSSGIAAGSINPVEGAIEIATSVASEVSSVTATSDVDPVSVKPSSN